MAANLSYLAQQANAHQLGQILQSAGLVGPDQVTEALRRQREEARDRQLGEILLEQGLLTQGQLLDSLFQQLTLLRQAYHEDPAATPALRFRGVRKSLDGRVVLDGVDLAIPAGKITAIIGVSGGGKSVTLKHMIGLMAPDTGEVWVGDRRLDLLSPKELNQVRRRFGMLFQGGALFDSLNVFDNVAFPLRENTDLSEPDIRQRVQQSLAAVNLPGMEGKFPDELSGGMLKRAALARALATRPEIILLDEPTAGLDPIIEHAIHHLICDTWLRTRTTMVLISHAVPEIFNWCHHVVALHQGKVLAAGPSRELRNATHPVIKQFVNGELEGPIKVL